MRPGDMGPEELKPAESGKSEEKNAFTDDLQSVWGPESRENGDYQVKSGDKSSADSESFEQLSQAFDKMGEADLAKSFRNIADKIAILERAFSSQWAQDSKAIMGPQSSFDAVAQISDPTVLKRLMDKMSNIGA